MEIHVKVWQPRVALSNAPLMHAKTIEVPNFEELVKKAQDTLGTDADHGLALATKIAVDTVGGHVIRATRIDNDTVIGPDNKPFSVYLILVE